MLRSIEKEMIRLLCEKNSSHVTGSLVKSNTAAQLSVKRDYSMICNHFARIEVENLKAVDISSS